MHIEYSVERVCTEELDLEDAGNCCIRCHIENYSEIYILVKTVWGRTHVLKFGPLLSDIGTFSDYFNLLYKSFDYKESKIQKEIEGVLLDARNPIILAEEISLDDAIKAVPQVADIFLALGEDE